MRPLLLIALLLPFTAVRAAESLPKLYPGLKAPKIQVSAWVKNGPPKATNHYRVVEFWATWCGPCRDSIPHLTELAKKYKGQIDFVGVSVYERGENIPERVKKFVAEMGIKMDYAVALDTTDNKTAKNWLEAAEQGGIPTAFLVDPKGTVLWIGHPMGLDPYLEKAVTGMLNAKDMQKQFISDTKAARETQKERADIDQAGKLWRAGKKDEANKLLDAIAAKTPEKAKAIKQMRLWTVYPIHDPESKALVQEYLASGEDGYASLGVFALDLVNKPDGDKALGKSLGLQIAEKSTTVSTLYYACIVLSVAGDYANSLKTADKAIALADKDVPKGLLDGLKAKKAEAESKLK